MRHALGAYLAAASGFAVLMVVSRSTRYVATALTFFCIAPLVFMDRPERVTLYTAALYLVHTGVAFALKDPAIAGVDAINTFITVSIGAAICSHAEYTNMEYWINKADEELIERKVTEEIAWNAVECR